MCTEYPTVVGLSDSSGWGELLSKVQDLIRAQPSMDSGPIRNIVKHLVELDCKCAVIEYPYHDEDFLYDYLHVLGRSHINFGKDCVKIHFFAGHGIREKHVLEDLDAYYDRTTVDSTSGNEYLGYMVIRPTQKFCVGRTILKYPFADDPSRHIHVRARYVTNLCGTDLSVVGTPFMEQDQASSKCAGASLWCLSYDLHRRYGTARFFPTQIAAMATEQVFLGSLTRGLTEHQIASVLRQLGCAVDARSLPLVGPQSAIRLRSVISEIYAYVESNLPVMLGYWEKTEPQGHAVLVVGHDLCEQVQCPEKTIDQGSPVFNSDFISCFYVQDDQRGPYRQLNIWTADSGNDSDRIRTLQSATRLITMPGLTSDANMLYGDALKIVIKGLWRKLLQQVSLAGDQQEIATEFRRARIRLYFQQSRRFLRLLRDERRGRRGLCDEHIEAYRTMTLPRYLFVCDFYDGTSPEKDGRFHNLGELLLDATAPVYAHEESVLALRCQETLLVKDRPSPIIDDQYDFASNPLAPLNSEDYRR